MTVADFTDFYADVNTQGESGAKRKPFWWQVRLAEQIVREGKWPATISLPTSSGKTSLIEIAVFLLALEADKPTMQRTARIRTFFVVDRRMVVDEAADHADDVAKKLAEPNSPILREVAGRLRLFGGGEPLAVARLRGGMYRDNTWADAPNQPLICVSTVDQVGSRLLFRGYQINETQWPVHAALVGNDSLLILDEAHLSQPFVDTVEAVQTYQSWAECKIAPDVSLVTMSATARDRGDVFQLHPEDYQHDEPLRDRHHASKLARLDEPKDFEKAAVNRALELSGSDQVQVTGIVVNRVASARDIFEQLRKLGHEAILLTGRIRPFDRDAILKEFLPRIKAGRVREAGRKLFVVATQTVEVGANIDFDALVTEAAALDALRQRFGRLDRLGQLKETHAWVIRRKAAKDDPVYGSALTATWDWLKANGAASGTLDFGVMALGNLLKRSDTESLDSAKARGPLMFPAHLEAWVQTNPAPAIDPDIAPFLHGPDALDAADVQIVWRGDLHAESPRDWIKTLSLAPPSQREGLPAPIGAAGRWLELEKQGEELVADIEGFSAATEPRARFQRKQLRPFCVWKGPEKSSVDGTRLRPGWTIVVPASYGGADDWGWYPASDAPVSDIGNECARELYDLGIRKDRRRVYPGVLKAPEFSDLKDLIEKFTTALDDGEKWSDICTSMGDLLVGIILKDEIARFRTITRYPDGEGFILESTRPKKPPERVRSIESLDEWSGEGDAMSFGDRPITLRKHTADVEACARLFAKNCGLNFSITETIGLAARLHDLGKLDDRFQAMLGFTGGEPLAKSRAGEPAAAARTRWKRSGYPAGMRHEFTSVALADSWDNLGQSPNPKLIRHLIGTHHGFGRAFPPATADEAPVPIRASFGDHTLQALSAHGIEVLDSNWIDAFWELTNEFGFWGLAYMEAILRRADCVVSRLEQERSSNE